MSDHFPILDFDDDRSAMLDPQKLVARHDQMPEHCVITFFQDVITKLLETRQLVEITSLHSEIGKHPVYKWEVDGKSIAIGHPGVGAPLVAGFLEELIALGGRKFIVCGGAGALDPAHTVGKLMIPIAAVRDEGTSYHYLPPGKETAPTANALNSLKATLTEKSVPFVLTKTWTTDAFYRETKRKVAMRRQEGCECVEMEASALFAVARFREVDLAQLLYAGDDLSGEFWDSRHWHSRSEVRLQLVQLAAAACLRIS